MENKKEAILQELRDRTPQSGSFWEEARDLVPGGLISGARKMEPYPMAKGEFLRNGFNDWATSMGYPFCMTGIGSLFQIHAMTELPVFPRDLVNEDEDALTELQLHFRLNHIHVPWMHLAFFSAAHTQENIEEMLRAFKASVEAVTESKGA